MKHCTHVYIDVCIQMRLAKNVPARYGNRYEEIKKLDRGC